MITQTRFVLNVVATQNILDITDQVMTIKTELESMGAEVVIEVVKAERVRSTAPNAPVEIETVEPVTPSEAPRASTGRAQVMYRVIDPRVVLGRVPHMVRMALLAHGPSTAQQLETLTNAGKKSVESALHMLRTKGSVESVPVVDGVPVVQRKFTKRQIQAGAPLV